MQTPVTLRTITFALLILALLSTSLGAQDSTMSGAVAQAEATKSLPQLEEIQARMHKILAEGNGQTWRMNQFVKEQSANIKIIDTIGYVNHGFPEVKAYLDSIVKTLITAEEMAKYQFETFLIDQASPNAFVMGAGYIFINIGMVANVESPDQLAMILGHEIAHELEQHPFESYMSSERRETRSIIAGLWNMGFLSYLDLALGMKYNRTQEYDADQLGTDMICSAGYSTEDGRTVFERFGQLKKLYKLLYPALESGSAIWSTHPISENRVEALDVSCGTEAKKHNIARFEKVRQPCRYRAMELRLYEYEMELAILDGWRFLGEVPDLRIQELTFEAVREHSVLMGKAAGQYSEKPLLAELFPQSEQVSELIATSPDSWSEENESLMNVLMLGFDWPSFDAPLSQFDASAKAIQNELFPHLEAAKDCSTCQFKVALGSPMEQRASYLRQSFGDDTNSTYENYLNTGELTSTSMPTAWVVYDNISVTEFVYGGVYNEYSFKAPLEFAEDFEIIRDTSTYSRFIEGPIAIHGFDPDEMSEDDESYLRDLRIIAEKASTYAPGEVDLLLLNPALIPFFSEHAISQIEFLDLNGLYAWHRLSVPSFVSFLNRDIQINGYRTGMKFDDSEGSSFVSHSSEVRDFITSRTLRHCYYSLFKSDLKK